MHQEPVSTDISQYSRRKILLISVVAALPMGLLGWIVASTLSY